LGNAIREKDPRTVAGGGVAHALRRRFRLAANNEGGEPLPPRDLPRQLAWWIAESWVVWGVLGLVAERSAGLMAWLALRKG
jgi:hypothetical protein